VAVRGVGAAFTNCLAAGDGLFRRGTSGGVLLSIVLLIAGWDLPVAVADGMPVVINCSQPPQVKPEHIILTCADATLAVDKIVWNSWTVDGATGHGVEFQDNCVPNCAQGSATYSPVTIRLSGATPPNFRYTSAVVTNQNTGKSDTWPMNQTETCCSP
jgi:hypothetical protein